MDDAPPKIELERLPKRDAVTRLRAVYAGLERGWRARQGDGNQQTKTKTIQQEEVL
jgi:hypothetical protein